MSIIFRFIFVIISMCMFSMLNADAANGADDNDNDTNYQKPPTVLIVTLFRNKQHILPYYFTYLERLNYPKNRIWLWFRSDHNEDRTTDVVKTWLFRHSYMYHSADFEHEEEPVRRPTETSIFDWPIERHQYIIKMKEASLTYARRVWAQYVFFLDADVLLTDPDTLLRLIRMNEPIIAPMLISDTMYSNFWGEMDSNFYYKRSENYTKIYNFEQLGKFQVPMISAAVLVRLEDYRTDGITFDLNVLQEKAKTGAIKTELSPNIPIDDSIIFALSANYSGVPLVLTNLVYGFVTVPVNEMEGMRREIDQLVNIKIHIINDLENGLYLHNDLAEFVSFPNKTDLSLDAIFMINLKRRPLRRRRMEQSFREIGIEAELVEALDGMRLTDKDIAEMGISFLPGYADPYHNRPMTKGEIGCFLSHYKIWLKMVDRNIGEALIIEDDIRFSPSFIEDATNIINEARQLQGYDLIYLGRKRLENDDEHYVENARHLVIAGYSYWTLGYILTLRGAEKLLDAKPLGKLLPVDEYLPIMFDRHPNETWSAAFNNRNLIAWSASPLILFPAYYTGEIGYISDTEDSAQISLDSKLNNMREKKGDKETLKTVEMSEQSMYNEDEELESLRNAIFNELNGSSTEKLEPKIDHNEL